MPDGRIVVELTLDTSKGDKAAAAFGKRAAQLINRQGGGGSWDLGKMAASGSAEVERLTARVTKLTAALKAQKQAGIEAFKAAGGTFKTKEEYAADMEKAKGRPLTDYERSKLGFKPNITEYARGSGAMSDARASELAQLRMQRAQGLRGYNAQQFFAQQSGGGLATTPFAGAGSGVAGGGTPPVIGSLAAMASSLVNKQLSGPAQMAGKVGAALAGLRVGVGLVSYGFGLLMVPLTWAAKGAREFGKQLDANGKQMAQLYSKLLQTRGMPAGLVAHQHVLSQIFGVSEQEVFSLGLVMSEMARKTRMASDSLRRSMPQVTATEQIKRQALVAKQARDAEYNALTSPIHQFIAKTVLKYENWALETQRKRSDTLRKQGWPLGKSAEMPRASIDRLAPSQWELRGLVLGNMGGTNPAVQTAKATTSMAKDMKTVVSNTANRGTIPYMKWAGAAMP